MREFDHELVSGRISRSVFKLAWPMVVMQLVNGSTGFVDHILVSRFVDAPNSAANAAIGISWQLFLVMVVFVASFFKGMSVLIAQHAGKKDREAIGRIAYNTFFAATYLQIFVFAPIGYLASPALLNFFNADPEVQVYALPYMRIMFTCAWGMFLMFMLTQAMQASGDARTPLKLGALSTIINIVVTAILITGAGPFPEMGTMGAAIGSCVAPIPSVCIALKLMYSGRLILAPPKRIPWIPDREIVMAVIRVGIPTGLQAVLLNLAGAFLIRYVGMLPNSAAAQAAYTICYGQWFNLVTWTAFGLRAASATLMGQNLGAGQMQRGKDSVGFVARVGACWGALLGVLFLTQGHVFMGLFKASGEPVLSYGIEFLRFLAVSGVFLAATLAYTGGLQGAGDTKTPMWIAFVTQIGILLGLCEIFLRTGHLTTTTIWMSIVIAHIMRFMLSFYFFRRGSWSTLGALGDTGGDG